MFFIGTCAGYLIDSTPSTIIPPECLLLDQQLLIHLWSRVKDEFRPLMQIEKKSTLLAWTNLTSHFQKSFPVNIVVNQQPSPSPSPPVVKQPPPVVKQPPIVVKQPPLPISSNLMDIPFHPVSPHPVTSVPEVVSTIVPQIPGQLQDDSSLSLSSSSSSGTEESSPLSRNLSPPSLPFSRIQSLFSVSWSSYHLTASKAVLSLLTASRAVLSLSAETMHFSSPLPFYDNG